MFDIKHEGVGVEGEVWGVEDVSEPQGETQGGRRRCGLKKRSFRFNYLKRYTVFNEPLIPQRPYMWGELSRKIAGRRADDHIV